MSKKEILNHFNFFLHFWSIAVCTGSANKSHTNLSGITMKIKKKDDTLDTAWARKCIQGTICFIT